MSTVAEIIEAVKLLDEQGKEEFLAKLADVHFEDAWDRQMEEDAAAGRWDALWQEALADIAAGRTRPLAEVIDETE